VLIGNNKFKGTATEVLIDYKLMNLIIFAPTPKPFCARGKVLDMPPRFLVPEEEEQV
jgi:hypothetical protein